jgi:hypothetical protein
MVTQQLAKSLDKMGCSHRVATGAGGGGAARDEAGDLSPVATVAHSPSRLAQKRSLAAENRRLAKEWGVPERTVAARRRAVVAGYRRLMGDVERDYAAVRRAMRAK